jgi:IS30 family transposase
MVVGSQPGSIFSILLPFGGIYQAPSRRRTLFLSVVEREEISRGLAAGESFRSIARRLHRSAATISREVGRNRGITKYRAQDAEDRAWRRAKRPKLCRLAQHPDLCTYVADRLRDDWSPEQIAGVLKQQYPTDCEMHVSHETIYKTLFIETRGVLARDLRAHLRSGRPMRRNVHNTITGQLRSIIKGAISIADRPAEVADRVVPGHWEGDLLLGRHWSQMATVVERTTRFTVLVQLAGRDMHAVTTGLSREMSKLPTHVRRSLTWDRGMELANHRVVTANTGLEVYFADPHSPWQRGTNENTNRLLRQYFPKGVSMATLTQDELDLVAAKRNARPRKTLDFDTPAFRFNSLLR